MLIRARAFFCRPLWAALGLFCCLACLATCLEARPAFAADEGEEQARLCIAQAGKAIDAADVAAFERLVDLDAILDRALGLFLSETQKPEVARQLPPLLTMLFSQAAAQGNGGGAVRNLLFSEVRAFVLNGVASGAFAGRKPTGQAAQGLLAPLFADASTGRKEILEIGRARPDGQGWLVPFVVHDAGNGEKYSVLGRVSPVDNGYRLTAVENLEELLRRVMAESGNVAP